MRNYVLLCLSILCLAMIGCKPDGAQDKPPKDLPKELVFPLSMQLDGDFTDVDLIRSQARSIIDYRVENSEKALSMMTYGYWWPEFVYHDGKISSVDHYAGYWVKYGDDFTYTYGVYDDVWGSGRYHYDLDKKELMLLDNDVEQEPKVYQGMYNGELMSYIGTHTFGINNGMQIKMVPLDNKPVKGS